MTAQVLSSELGHLISESKRRNPELRQAAEASLADLKALPTTSEKQITADLARRSQFINPFLIACATKNAKYASTGISCLQRLAVAQALPKTRLKDVLDAVIECSTLGLDIQLKILQTLPALLQNYAEQINGSAFFTTIQICSTLQASKIASVSSTAAATLQQLISSLYDKLAHEDQRALELPTTADVKIGKETLRLRTVAFDAYRFFHDLCLLISGEKPLVVAFAPTSEPALLELIESILTGHAKIIDLHAEQAYVVETVLLPYLHKAFSQRSAFPVLVRVTRVLYLLIKNHCTLFPTNSETALRGLLQGLDQDGIYQWKRTLFMEVFREIFTDFSLVLKIHMQLNQTPDAKAIIPECLAAFVRLATEKPAIIGLGQHSTMPIGNYFQRESSGDPPSAAAAAAGSAGVPTAAVPGISIQFSHVRSPCIEQLDKSEAPSTPETYVYSLVLACLNNLAESLSRFILLLTVQQSEKSRRPRSSSAAESPVRPGSSQASRKDHAGDSSRQTRKKTFIVNPLTLHNHAQYSSIKASENLIDSAWHAILACCSTYFHAALDTENYRSLVRTFQKFTQVAGLLQMEVPRDAFLTTLGKNAMPPNLVTATMPSASAAVPQTPSSLNNIKDFLNVENIVSQASSFLPERRRYSVDGGEPVLNIRNLLCLRALLNLAIALGPMLESSWTIIFETLQQADRVLAAPGSRMARPSSSSNASSADTPSAAQQISSEAAAVQSATSRLLESTADLPNEAFVTMLSSLCALVHKEAFNGALPVASPPPGTPNHKRRIASFSGLSVKTGVQENDYLFVLAKLRDLSTLNMKRFVATSDEVASGWSMLLEETTSMATDSQLAATARLLAVDLIRKLVVDTIGLSPEVGDDIEATRIYARALMPLQSVASSFRRNNSDLDPGNIDETAIEAHGIVLQSLRSILEQIGDSLKDGWASVLEVIASSFEAPRMPSEPAVTDDAIVPSLIAPNLGHAAFGSLQLICSDFLTPQLDTVFPNLIDLLYQFNAQEEDLNMSLTTTTFFWNTSDFLYNRIPSGALHDVSQQEQFNIIDALQAHSEHYVAILWLYLVHQLARLVADSRDEVRNSAIHTAVRIFDNHGEDFSPDVWQLSFRSILLPMLSFDVNGYKACQNDGNWIDKSEMKAKIGTTQVLLTASSKLIAEFLGPIGSAAGFSGLWSSLSGCFVSYLAYNLHDINAAVFTALHTITSKASPSSFPPAILGQIAELWDNHKPNDKSILSLGSNNKAFEAYCTALDSIYSLRHATDGLYNNKRILDNLKTCIRTAETSAYSSDIDTMTTLQTMVIRMIGKLRTDSENAMAAVVSCLGSFIGLPLEVSDGLQPSGQTFIALSKASMAAVERLLSKDCAWSELIEHGALQLVLENLERCIGLKYHWDRQGRDPALWQRATSASLLILKRAVPAMSAQELEAAQLRSLWELIVRIVHHVANADHLEHEARVTKRILQDEQFDMEALKQFVELITVPLGVGTLPDTIRRSYTRALFSASLIHPYWKNDIPDLEQSPLDGIYKIRYGRTVATPPRARHNMSYMCFRILLHLLSQQESQPHQIRLAKAAAPYVILRAALPLQAYIADQPLRASIPVPMSLRKELVTILTTLSQLRCEPTAIPATLDAESAGGSGAHLVRLYPLIRRALAVGGPPEIRAALDQWLQRMEMEIGLVST